MSGRSVYAIGSFVELETGGEPQRAQVTAVQLREGGKATYEVVWWHGSNRTCVWVEECEVKAAPDWRTATIGFKGTA